MMRRRTSAEWVAQYAISHRHPVNRACHTLGIPTIAISIAFRLPGAIMVVAVLLGTAVFAQTPPSLHARFIGNMAFAISDGRTTLFTDFPYESGYSVYMEYDSREIRSDTAQALSLITHRHGDHWNLPLFERTRWKVVGPEDAVSGVDARRVVRSLPVAPTRQTITFEDLTIDALPTPHANIGHYSYLVTWHGQRLYFTGDTDDPAQLLDMKNVDVAFVSPWLYERARESGRRLDAHRIVIYHHTAGASVAGCAGTCSVPGQGETLRLQ